MKPLYRMIVFVLAALMLCAAGCAAEQTAPPQQDAEPPAEDEGPEGGAFVEQGSLAGSLAAEGNTTVTLTGDESVDMTGAALSGRKQILLNGHTLTLTGAFAVAEGGVFDVKPGEGTSGDAIDLAELTFDTSAAPADLEMELALIEIRPGIAITPPQTGGGVGIQEFPNVLTVIAYFPGE